MFHTHKSGTKFRTAIVLGLSLSLLPGAQAADSNDIIHMCKDANGTYQPDFETAHSAREACALNKEAAARRAFAISRDNDQRDESLDAWDALYYDLDLVVMSDETHLDGSVVI